MTDDMVNLRACGEEYPYGQDRSQTALAWAELLFQLQGSNSCRRFCDVPAMLLSA